ncbi:MAG: hypothetical protein C4524_03665 [Candidatus Zixiibacteriota bacterium]|nr:MAG: hypothetical protein C4524_03665 [candidate division Zixibacteria bacterium]
MNCPQCGKGTWPAYTQCPHCGHRFEDYLPSGPDPVACNDCGRPLESLPGWKRAFMRAPRQCPDCLLRRRETARLEGREANLGRAAICGLAAGAAVVVLLFLYLALTGKRGDWVVAGLGLAVGHAVVWGSGKMYGPRLAVISVAVTILALVCADCLTLSFFAGHDTPLAPWSREFFRLWEKHARTHPSVLISWGIALWAAVRIPLAPPRPKRRAPEEAAESSAPPGGGTA